MNIDNTAIWAAVLTGGAGILAKLLEAFLNWMNEKRKIKFQETNMLKHDIEGLVRDIIMGIHGVYSGVETLLAQMTDDMEHEGNPLNKEEMERQRQNEVSRINNSMDSILENERMLNLIVPLSKDEEFNNLSKHINEVTNVLQKHTGEFAKNFSAIQDDAEVDSPQYVKTKQFYNKHVELKEKQQEPIKEISEKTREFLTKL